MSTGGRSNASIPAVIYINEPPAVAEGQAGPLQSGSTVLGEVATKLTNMFVMVDREAKNAKIHVNFLTEKVEEGKVGLEKGEDIGLLSAKLRDIEQRQERIVQLLERRKVPAYSKSAKTPRHEGTNQLLEYAQVEKLLSRVWNLQDMIVKDALVDEFEDEELEDNVDVEAPGGKSTANLKVSVKSGMSLSHTQQMTPLKASAVPVLKQTVEELNADRVVYKSNYYTGLLNTLIFLGYLLALVLYVYIRIRYTLVIGNAYIAYGVVIFIGELCGALSMIIYGITIVRTPKNQFPQLKDTSGIPATREQYHVRVLIPCYSESFEIVKRTAQAAYMAPVPYGCRKAVYICDDGKDVKKRKWVEAQNTGDLIYVSGRVRAKGEVNGKSGNLNNCMRNLIYKNLKESRISKREIIVIFDADMVCTPEFFMKTVPYFDIGDNIGMVLSPQCFHNVDKDADIFNHQNIHFWEYMQPGFDAMDFISCTGTNFCVRARAMAQCGWFPEHTITEDFGLGISLTKFNWKCKYVQEYLAIGEAPDQIRNAFQQRSRWCKGHFQLFFSPACPLIDTDLPVYQRLMFSSSLWSYCTAAFLTPLMFFVPVISVLTGVFPIAINFWAAVALTVYYVATNLLQYRVKTLKHFKILWFANIANIILWVTYFKGVINTFLAAKLKRRLTFKTTAKGKAAFVVSTLKDLWLHLSFFILSIISLIIGFANLQAEQNQTLLISLCWCFYNMVPYYLVLHYTYIGRGQSLRQACTALMYLQQIAGVVALVLLWAYLPKDYDFKQALGMSFEFFEAQRSGVIPEGGKVAWRSSSHTGDTALYDLRGGWYQGSVSGHLKVGVQNAFSTTMLAWAMLTFPQAYNKGDTRQYALDTIRWGANFVRKLNVEDTSYVGFVGNQEVEAEEWNRPEDSTTARVATLYPTQPTQLFDAIDVQANVASALAATATLFTDVDLEFALDCLSSAKKAYTEATLALETYDPDNMTVEFDELVYRSGSIYDDMFFASSWLYRATNSDAYLNDARRYRELHTMYEKGHLRFVMDWDQQFWGGVLLLHQITQSTVFENEMDSFLKNWVCGQEGEVQKIWFTPKGRAYNEAHALSLASTATASFMAAAYAQTINGYRYSHAFGYRCFALVQARYILGDTKRSYVVGYGDNYPTQPKHRAASCPDKPKRCTIAESYFSTSPNPKVLRGALVFGPGADDDYVDERNVIDSQVSLESNAGLAAVLAGVASLEINWPQCLQGYGVVIQNHPIC